MSDETTVKEPRTEAGRAMLADWGAQFLNGLDLHTITDRIVAIEDEARSAVLAEVRVEVEGLPTTTEAPCWCDVGDSFVIEGRCDGCGHPGPHGSQCPARTRRGLAFSEFRDSTLALIDHISEGK